MSKDPTKRKAKRSRSKRDAVGKVSPSKRQKVGKVKGSRSKLPLQAREGAPSPDEIKMPPPALLTTEDLPVEKEVSSKPVPQDDGLPRVPSPAKLSTHSDKLASPIPDSASARTSISSAKSTSPLISSKAASRSSQKSEPVWTVEKAPRVTKITMSEGHVGVGKSFLLLKPTNNLGQRDWPKISLGSNAPLPRWRLKESEQDPVDGRDLNIDLIKTHEKRTHIKNVSKDDHVKSGDSSIGLGALVWEFEPGPSKVRKEFKLSKEQLYEFAYLSLLDAMSDYQSRSIFREAIRRENLKSIRNVEDPLPPLPAPPRVTHFGQDAGAAEWPKMPKKIQDTSKGYFGNQYSRPSTAIPDERNIGSQTEDWLVSRMRHHQKGTSRIGEVSRSYDPYLKPELNSDSFDGKLEPSLYEHKEFDEEKQVAPTDTGRLARVSGVTFDDDGPRVFHLRHSRSDSTTQPRFPPHRDAIRKSERTLPSKTYFLKCKEICEDPEKREMLFPEPDVTRRVRIWAGAIIPQGAALNWKLPSLPRILRPFAKFKPYAPEKEANE